MKYTVHDGEMVSLPWKPVLVEMDKTGNNDVLEGHRTFARQQYFWDCYQCQCCNNGNLAAYPTHNAPHIWTGRVNHAIDFGDGQRAKAWLNNHGVNAVTNVPGEPWHVYVDADELERAAKKFGADKWEVLPDHIEKHVRALIHHRHGAVARKGKNRRKYLQHVAWRQWHRNWLERALKRADKPSTKKLLRDLLDVDKRKHKNPPRRKK